MRAILCQRLASSNEENLRIRTNTDILAGGQVVTLVAAEYEDDE